MKQVVGGGWMGSRRSCSITSLRCQFVHLLAASDCTGEAPVESSRDASLELSLRRH